MDRTPHSIECHASLTAACALIDRLGVSLLVVTTDGRVSGLITARDVQVAHRLMGRREHPPSVADLCPLPVYVAQVDEPLDHVLLEMADRELSSAVVADQRGKVAGVLTAPIVCQSLAMTLRGQVPVRFRFALRAVGEPEGRPRG